MAGTILVKPGQTITVVGIPADAPLPPYIPGPADPGYSPPWATLPPGGQGGGPVDPGYSPPWAQVPGGGPVYPSHPIYNPGGPPGSAPPGFWGGGMGPGVKPQPHPEHPIVIPPTEPPPVEPPTDGDDGTWVWAWSPQAGRWVWVKVPGEGEAGPK